MSRTPRTVPTCCLLLSLLASCDDSTPGHDARPDAGAVDPGTDGFDNPCVADVERAFGAIGAGQALLAHAGDVGDTGGPIPWPRYTDTIDNALGINNHFQGAQRLRSHPVLVFTGGDLFRDVGSLFLIELASRPAAGRWGTNFSGGPPPAIDAVVGRVDLPSEHWHAGGPAALGDLVAVPMEGGGRSSILFYDLSEPSRPRALDVTIERADAQAAAVALTRVDRGRILAAVRTATIVDFYLSQSAEVEDGFGSGTRWDHDGIAGIADGLANAQNLSFLRQCDGELYLAGFYNTSPGLPQIPGTDRSILLQLTFPGGDVAQPPVVDMRAETRFACDGSCNFDAVTALFVADAETLLVYGARHYRERDDDATQIRIREF